MLDQIETISKFSGFVFKAASAVGALFLLFYCSHLGFYPSGVTLGDTLLFIFFSMGFCFVYGIFFYLVFCMGYLAMPFVRLIQKLSRTQKISNVIGKSKYPLPQVGTLTVRNLDVVLPGMLMLFVAYVLIDKGKLDIALGISSSAIMIFLYWIFILRNPLAMNESALLNVGGVKGYEPKENSLKLYKKPAAWLMFALIPLVGFQDIFGLTLNAAAALVGIRAEQVTVQVTKDRLPLFQKRLQNISDLSSRLEILPDGGGAILKKVDVLFQGIGSRTLIAIKTQKEEVRFLLPSQDITVVRTLPIPN